MRNASCRVRASFSVGYLTDRTDWQMNREVTAGFYSYDPPLQCYRDHCESEYPDPFPSVSLQPMCMLTLLSVDEILLTRYMNLSTNSRGLPFWVKHMNSVWSEFTERSMPFAACSKLCRRDSAWVIVFARSVKSSV